MEGFLVFGFVLFFFEPIKGKCTLTFIYLKLRTQVFGYRLKIS